MHGQLDRGDEGAELKDADSTLSGLACSLPSISRHSPADCRCHHRAERTIEKCNKHPENTPISFEGKSLTMMMKPKTKITATKKTTTA
jgi:hypothetical protein